MKYFRELNLNLLKDKIVILDVDGTITFDKHHEVAEPEKVQLEKLKDIAQNVYLVSNGERDRTKKLGEILNVLVHESEYQKPDKKVLHHFPHQNKQDIVIVGDKFLTDGLLALQTGILFLHVKSLKRETENFFNKFVFWVDDFVGNTFEFVKLIRPKQWLKNFLVFAPVFFAGKFLDIPLVIDALLAFLAFSLAASCVYIINDVKDVEQDRFHPKKRFRPLATGNLERGYLIIFAEILFLSLVAVLLLKPILLFIVSIYVLFNLIYTFKFKNIPVYDLVMVATMYLMRAIAGGLVTDIYISPWLVICVFFGALFMITAKRYGEFGNPTRKVLKYYSKEAVLGLLIASATLTVASYTIYTIIGISNKYSIYSSIIVTTIFFLTINDILTGHKKIESPETYLITNKKIVFLIFIWFVFEAFFLYFFS
jgi:HAD superfamily phosphatase (TIGR01668 family)